MRSNLSRTLALALVALLPATVGWGAERRVRTTGTVAPNARGASTARTTPKTRPAPADDESAAARPPATKATAATKAKSKRAPQARSTPEGQLTSATSSSRRVRTTRYQPTPPPDLIPEDAAPPEMPAETPESMPAPSANGNGKLKPIPSGGGHEVYEGETIYEDGSWYEDDCSGGACDDSCGIPCATGGCGGLIAGFDFVFLQANFSDNPGFFRTQTNGQLFNDNAQNFIYNPQLASRPWFGYEHASGLGARARYFVYDESSSPLRGTATFDTAIAAPFTPEGFRAPSTNAAGDSFLAVSGVRIANVDLEGTKRACFGNWSLLAAGGFRYGLVRQTYEAQITDNQSELLARAQYGHRFEGFGPLVGFEARRQVTCNISFFSAARFALLFGHGSGQLTVLEGLQSTVPQTTLTKSRRSDLLPIAELQVGGEYLSNFRLGSAQLFGRGALEAQLYQGAGSATSEDGDLALFGGSFSLGLRY